MTRLSFSLSLRSLSSSDHGSRWAGQAITTDSWAVENAPPRVIGRQQDGNQQERVVMPGGEAPIPEPTPHNQQQQQNKKNKSGSKKKRGGKDQKEEEEDEDFYESLENLEDTHHVFKQQARGGEEEEDDEEF
jgi:hypothetical protein